ncbi:MAG: DUF4111 domain-containing protein [Actinobacteria bacterium]|nr:DUF4111 domain-containing protein [Actinomycetota bacterium]
MSTRDEPQILRVAEVANSVLDDAVIGVYLHGSAVLGGLRPTSDLDFLVVVDRQLDASTRTELTRRLLDVSGKRALHPGRPVELTVVATDQLVPWSHPPHAEFQYGEWLRDDYETGHVPVRTLAHDLTVLLDTVQRHGRALLGPPAETVVPAIPPADLVSASLEGVDGLLQDLEGDERNVLLTFARMLVTAESGQVAPKDVAAEAVAGRVGRDCRRLLHAAVSDYNGRAEFDWSSHTDDVRTCVDQLLALVP